MSVLVRYYFSAFWPCLRHNKAMIWKNALKYPVLIIGVVTFGIFLSSEYSKDWWRKVTRRYKPSTCDVTMDRVKPKAPSNWSFDCPTVQLLVVDIDFQEVKGNKLNLRQEMYRELANNLVKLGNWSNLETMHFLKKIKMNMKHPHLTVESMTNGSAIVDLVKLTDPKSIARHLKMTVKIKEVKK